MRKCRNWQTSKTKDLVIIAIVWVQVPSSALNNKTGIKQSVWSLSYCSKPKRALNPWFKVSPPARSARGMRSPGPHSVSAPLRSLQNRRPPDVLRSPLRSGRCRTDVPRTSCNPSSARLRLLWGRSTMVQGLASGSVGSWHEVPRTSLGLRSASVVAEQTSPRRLATHLPQGSGRRGRAGALY